MDELGFNDIALERLKKKKQLDDARATLESEKSSFESPSLGKKIGLSLLGGLMGGLGEEDAINNIRDEKSKGYAARIKAIDEQSKGLDDNLFKVAEFKSKQAQAEQDRKNKLEDAKELARFNSGLKTKKATSVGDGNSLDTFAKKKQVSTLADAITKRQAGIDELSFGVSQLEDPNKTPEEKVLIGEMLLKKLNDPVFSDAVGAEEVKRLGSYLQQFSLSRPGSTFGRDLPNFTKQVRNKADLLSQTQQASENRLGGITGQRPAVQNQTPVAPPPPPNEKIIGGVRYRKVPGGWEEAR